MAQEREALSRLSSLRDGKNKVVRSCRCPRQKRLKERREIKKNIQQKQKDVELLNEKLKTINHQADQTVEETDRIFDELTRSLYRSSVELEKEVRAKQQAELSRVRVLQEKLEQEIRDLRKKDAELELQKQLLALSFTEDEIQNKE